MFTEIIIGIPFALAIVARSYSFVHIEFATACDKPRQPTTVVERQPAPPSITDPLDGYDPEAHFLIHDEEDEEGYQSITFIQ